MNVSWAGKEHSEVARAYMATVEFKHRQLHLLPRGVVSLGLRVSCSGFAIVARCLLAPRLFVVVCSVVALFAAPAV